MNKITPAAGQKLMRSPDIMRALLSKAGPAKWHDEDVYCLADQAAAVGAALVVAIHKHLNGARIGYLFRKKLSGRDRITLAKASIVSAKLEFFSDLDFIVELNWDAWMHLEPHQRVALVDHELCHFGVDRTGETTKHVLISHDLEEFGAIVKRWGLWKQDVAEFGGIVREQLDLLAGKGPA